MKMLGVHAFFIQQVGMESGIDIKFPFCALAAKLRKGRGDHHRGDSDDVRARMPSKCSKQDTEGKKSMLGFDVGTHTTTEDR